MSDAPNQTPPGQPPHQGQPVPHSAVGGARFTRAVTRSPLTLGDLTQDLLWPRLFRSAGLALAPSRLVFSVLLLVALGLVDRLLGLISGRRMGPIESIWSMVAEAAVKLIRALDPRSPNHEDAGRAVVELFVVGPARVLAESWWTVLLGLPVALVLIAVLGSAIARGALCEFALNAKPTWTQTLGFATRRWFSAWGALSLPLLAVALLGLAFMAFGWLVMATTVLNVVGALVFGLVLVLAVVAAVGMFAYAAGNQMLTGAIAAENADAFDAIQRVYAYVIARPGRTVIYSLLNFVQFVLAFTVVASIVFAALWFVQSTTRVPIEQLPPPSATFVTMRDGEGTQAGGGIAASDQSAFAQEVARASRDGGTVGDFGSRADREGIYSGKNATFAWSLRIVDFWTGVLKLLVLAFGVSFYFCAGAVQYLLLRQLVDGQDANEIWIEGSTDAALRPLVNPAAVAKPDAQPGAAAPDPTGPRP
ncbi:MAG: hypothetical protein ACK55O_09675 [Phycisphaerales bacterium]|jgi:hypothetical protein|nr:hypothetical protein [Phycisphaeraceae bacterium]